MDRIRQTVKGLTLVEVIVATLIFMGLTTVTLVFYQTSISSRRKTEVHTEAYRSALVGIEHLRRELRGVRIQNLVYDPETTVIPTADNLTYQPPEVQNGHLLIESQGRIRWLPERQIYVDGEGRLWSQEGVEPPRLLSRLGPGGAVEFRRSDEQLLEVELVADYQQPGARKVITESIFLSNQFR